MKFFVLNKFEMYHNRKSPKKLDCVKNFLKIYIINESFFGKILRPFSTTTWAKTSFQQKNRLFDSFFCVLSRCFWITFLDIKIFNWNQKWNEKFQWFDFNDLLKWSGEQFSSNFDVYDIFKLLFDMCSINSF